MTFSLRLGSKSAKYDIKSTSFYVYCLVDISMPEGPEARTTADKLQWVSGLEVCSLVITAGVPGKRNHALKSALCNRVWSYGKKVIISLTQSGDLLHLVFELGMSGRFTYSSESATKVSFYLISGVDNSQAELHWGYTRPHGAALHLFSNSELVQWLDQFGPDILATYVSADQWFGIWKKPKIKDWNLCKALLDQHVIAGVGNYLKSEILYFSRLHPGRKVRSLSDTELETLRQVTHYVTYVSYTYGGCTLESFISPDGTEGRYPVAVYGWSNSKETKDKYGNEILRTKEFDGRTTSWCPSIQR
jgi:formamidopyrimidine-DNA glycosylase